MKPTTDGRWAHLACAMWIPGSISVSVCNFPCILVSKFLTPFLFQKLVYLISRKWNQLMV